jgi:outer membrane protein assembly factor BamB
VTDRPPCARRTATPLRCACAVLFVLVAHHVTPARSSDLTFESLGGWWGAEPVYNGQPSTVYLHFASEDGKQVVRLSMMAIGGFDQPIGTVTVSGNRLDMQPYPWPLDYDCERDVLGGVLPDAAVPVHRIAVEFHRIEAPARPAPRAWNYPSRDAAWSRELGSPVWAGLALDRKRGQLVVGADDGDLLAIPVDGRAPHWRFATHGPVRARATVAGDAIYVPSDDGNLYKLDAATGRELWRAMIDAGSPPRVPTTDETSRWDFYSSSATVDQQRVFIGSRNGRIHALDARSGEPLWEVDSGEPVTSTPVVERDRLFVAGYDGTVRALSTADGRTVWTYDTGQPIPADLALAGGRVLAGSRSYDLVALDAANGQPRWTRYLWFSWVDSAPVVDDGVVYLGSSDATSVFAMELASGQPRWQTRVPGWAWPQVVLAGDRLVAVTASHGTFRPGYFGAVVALDRRSGEIVWLNRLARPGTKLEWGYGAAPVADENFVYVADLSGRLSAIPIR